MGGGAERGLALILIARPAKADRAWNLGGGMARFICCTLSGTKAGGEPVWINVDLIAAIQVDQFGLGSKITFAGEEAPHFYVQEKPHEIFDRKGQEVKASPKP